MNTIDTFGEAMREYIEYVAQTRAPMGLLGLIMRSYSRWQMRKMLNKLSLLNDYQLIDIGITRWDLNWLIAQPRDCDLRWEIGRLSGCPDRLLHLAGSIPQSGAPQPSVKWKSESSA